MQPMSAAIPARTERQAMDWSLVLVSQGIATTIERDPEANLWRLIIDAPDYPRAFRPFACIAPRTVTRSGANSCRGPVWSSTGEVSCRWPSSSSSSPWKQPGGANCGLRA